MQIVFNMDGVICKPEDKILWKFSQPILNVTEFMQWLKKNGHTITIWCERENTLENKIVTEQEDPQVIILTTYYIRSNPPKKPLEPSALFKKVLASCFAIPASV